MFRKDLVLNLLGCEVGVLRLGIYYFANTNWGLFINRLRWIWTTPMKSTELLQTSKKNTFDRMGVPVRDQLIQVVGKDSLLS